MPIAGMVLDKCMMNNIGFNGNIDASTIVSCYIGGILTQSDKIKGLGIYTTKINQINRDCANANNATYVNCNIKANSPKATYINCIISGTNNTGANSGFTNCLYNSWEGIIGSSNTGCWSVSMSTSSYLLNSNLDARNVDLTNYIGTDGTVIGVTGTSNPHTLTPTTPKVLTHALSVDEVGSTLSVTLTVGN